MKKEENKNEIIRISRKNLKKLMVATALAATMTTTSLVGLIGIAKTAYQRSEGAEYLADLISQDVELPKSAMWYPSADGDSYGEMTYLEQSYNLVDGVQQENWYHVKIQGDEVGAVLKDVVNDGIAAGFTVDQMAVFLEEKLGYSNYEGSTPKGIKKAKEEAYLEIIREHSEGVSR